MNCFSPNDSLQRLKFARLSFIFARSLKRERELLAKFSPPKKRFVRPMDRRNVTTTPKETLLRFSFAALKLPFSVFKDKARLAFASFYTSAASCEKLGSV